MIKSLILPILSLLVSPLTISSRATISRAIEGTKDTSYASSVSVEYLPQQEEETYYHFKIKNNGDKILTEFSLTYTDEENPVGYTTYLYDINLPPQKTYDYYETDSLTGVKPGVQTCSINSATAVSGTVYDSSSVSITNLLYGDFESNVVYSSPLTGVLLYFDATNHTSLDLSLGFIELYQDGELFTTWNSEFFMSTVTAYSTINVEAFTLVPTNLLYHFDTTLTIQAYFYKVIENNTIQADYDYGYQIAYISLGIFCVLFSIGLIAVVIIFCYRKEKKK